MVSRGMPIIEFDHDRHEVVPITKFLREDVDFLPKRVSVLIHRLSFMDEYGLVIVFSKTVEPEEGTGGLPEPKLGVEEVNSFDFHDYLIVNHLDLICPDDDLASFFSGIVG
jgi:hypothetical protein